MTLALLLSARDEMLLQQRLADDRSNTTDSESPEKILDANPDFGVEIEQRGRGPILRDEENAGERERGRDQAAPDDLRPIAFARNIAGQPGAVENQGADKIGVMVAHRRDSPAEVKLTRGAVEQALPQLACRRTPRCRHSMMHFGKPSRSDRVDS